MHASLFITAFALIPMAMTAPSHRLPVYARQNSPVCDLGAIQQPASALPPPTADMSLVLVALGQGTQNYTCTNTTATPAPIGALAQLFNASCAMSTNPTAGTASLDSVKASASIGAHFFLDNTTPDFEITGLGNTIAKKVDDTPAPDATKDVKWLRLEAKTGSTSDVKMVYRLNTVGGMAPATCADTTPGQVITVDYEAQYWVYA